MILALSGHLSMGFLNIQIEKVKRTMRLYLLKKVHCCLRTFKMMYHLSFYCCHQQSVSSSSFFILFYFIYFFFFFFCHQ